MVVKEREPAEDLVYEIEPAVQQELLKHPGEWAALAPGRVIAIRETSTEAYEAARAAGFDTPVLYPIPDSRSGYSYY